MATGGMQPFFWGSGGQRLTPQEVERQRRLADAVLAQAGDTSPAASPLAILSRPLQTLGGVFRENRAAEAERLGLEQAQARIDPLIAALTGGGSSYSSGASPVSSYAGSVTAPSVPSGERAGYIRNGLIDRGLQPHVADAFLLNFQDESGLNPDINEAAPIVPGSRGGYGLYQLTGPRRRAYEAYASERGVPTSDIDAQLDFLMHELQGPESRAAQSILGASNVNDAAVSIVRDFLRPAEEHRDRRIAEYMAYASPEDSAMAYAPQGSGISNADLMGGTALDAIEQVAPTSDPMVMALSAPSPAPVQVAQAGGGNDLLASILAAQADPWAQQQYGGMLNSLLSNELTRINQANDPLRQLQLEREALELEALRNPWSAQPATAEQLAPWGITPNPGESWTFGQDGTPELLFGPSATEPNFINVETPNGIQTFDIANPTQAAQVNELFSTGQGRQVGLGAGDTAAQDRINRLTENLQNTGTVLDPNAARDVATAITDGRYVESRHPTTGEVIIVDVATGNRVSQGGIFNPDGIDEPVSDDVSTPTDSPYGEAFPNSGQSFGLEGAARGVANTVSGIFGGTFDPSVQQTQADFGVLRESLLNDIASTYGRQPPSWLLQEIRSLTPEAGSPLVSAERAVSQLNSLGRHMENERRVQVGILENTQLTPQTRQEIELRISGIDSGLARINGALQSFGRQAQEGESPAQPSEDGWIDLGNGIRMREVQ